MASHKTILISAGILIVSYLSLTWFFFGSPHPCGILEARLKPYAVDRAYEVHFERDRLMEDVYRAPPADELPEGLFRKFGSGNVTPEERDAVMRYGEYTKYLTELRREAEIARNRSHGEFLSIPQTVSVRVRQYVWSLTPAECFWQAITWKKRGIHIKPE
jgi:hypothetical protein